MTKGIEVVERFSIGEVDLGAYRAVGSMEQYVRNCSLEPGLLQLVKLRASQINACAHCLAMHAVDARAVGEDQRRLDVLSAWQDVPEMFTEREQCALSMTEALTLVAENRISDDLWRRVQGSFSETEMVMLLMAISTINVWNRLAIATGQSPAPRKGRRGGEPQGVANSTDT